MKQERMISESGKLHPETLAIHAGHAADPATGAVIPPINLSTTFERDEDGGYSRGFVYSRRGNPNRDALESALAQLEGGGAAAMFSSGLAAASSILQTLRPGDHVVAPDDVYHGTRHLIAGQFAHWGIESTFVDMSDPETVASAMRSRTRLVWIETPSNPLLKITDITAVSAIARSAGALLICDSTFATPILQRPLEHGADLVLHATTKYIGGHGDVLGGVVIAKEAGPTFDRIREYQCTGGAVPSPFECWLTLRSLKTLPLRMKAHSENAMAIAEFLRNHTGVEAVHYPGLASHPGHAIAARQMKGFGGMISFQVHGDEQSALRVAAGTKLFARATSLGGVESLIEHRASIEGPETQTPRNVLRLSVGLEHVEDLIEDLESALSDAW